MQQDDLWGAAFGPKTLVELVRHRAAVTGSDVCFRFLTDGEEESEALTFAELDRRARQVAAFLQSHRLEGQRALLLYPAGLDFICAFFGCLYAGVIAVPAYPPRMNRKMDRIDAIAADAEAAVALTDAAVLERVQPLLELTPDLKRIKWLATDQLPERLEDKWSSPTITGETLAFLQYTSGSTGTPKGVMLNHTNIVSNCTLITHAFELTRTSMGVFWLPSYHDMGLVGGILQPLYMGRPNVIMSPMAFLQRPFRWLSAISRYRATCSGGPNFAYDLCVRKITPEQRSKLDLSTWSVAFNGAEPVRAETLDRFAEVFESCGFRREAFYPCYGLAEATLLVSGGTQADPPVVRSYDAKALENGEVVSVPQSEAGARRLVSAGQSLPNEYIAIVNPETLSLAPPNEVGEIWLKSPTVAQGYWRKPEETEHTFRAQLADTGEGPFMRTGDLGFFQSEDLFIAGRLKDLIIIRGLNHYPHDIELSVEKCHPAIRPSSSAAFAIEDDEDESHLVIVCEIERTAREDVDAVLAAVRRAVAREHELTVTAIRLLKPGGVPKTSSGKIQRHACRNAFIQGSLDTMARWDIADGEPPPAAEPEVAKEPREAARPKFEPSWSNDRAWQPAGEDGGKIDDQQHAAATEGSTNGAKRVAKKKTTAEQVLEEVHRIAKERARGLSLDTSITELGLDSLERMEILAALEERFGGRFPEEIPQQLETCRDVVDAVETYLGPAGKSMQLEQGPEIPAENYRFDLYREYQSIKKNLEMLEASGLGNPFFNVHQRVTNDTTMIDGRELINFSSYNYVGMSGDPRVAEASKRAIDQYGTSVSASRLVSGEKTIHGELERAIADFLGTEAAIVYVGGHSTNETTIGHLFGPGDLILHDALAHNSIIQGCILSGARRRAFPHNDWREVDQLLTDLRSEYRRVLIAIEGVYSMDGDIPDLPKFVEVKKRHKVFLMVDEAHSIGSLGAHGRGIGEYHHVPPTDVDLWMGTLSKSFGSCGGYIAGCNAVVEYLKYTAPGFVFSVGMSPPNAAAALESIRVLESEPERVARLHERAKLFLSLAKAAGLNTGLSKDSPVVPIIVGNSMHSLELSRALARRGINVQPILYPAVEEKAARLRFFLTSNHTPEQIRTTVAAVAEELRKIQPPAAARESGNGAATKRDTHKVG
ncbi:MAG TPA: aminotransferase class I/II-fold pyridoxal phosphate-dependent enzyme [Pirellulales bacterium]|nr:aminotransferase class I/II-fold pyridoxal phosphate-dependent enzyme [Pirellulales bacterium]